MKIQHQAQSLGWGLILGRSVWRPKSLLQLNDVLSPKDYCWGSGRSLGLGSNTSSNCLQGTGLVTASQPLSGHRQQGLAAATQQPCSASGRGGERLHEKGATDLPTHPSRRQDWSFQRDLRSTQLPTHAHQHSPSAKAGQPLQ